MNNRSIPCPYLIQPVFKLVVVGAVTRPPTGENLLASYCRGIVGSTAMVKGIEEEMVVGIDGSRERGRQDRFQIGSCPWQNGGASGDVGHVRI